VDAETNYLAALGFYNPVRSENAQHVSNSLATLYTQLGNFEAAEAIYRDALKSLPPHTAFANTQKQNLAAVYQQTNKLEEAQKLLEEVVKSEKESTGAGSVSYAISLQNLAALHQKKGDYESAKNLYTQALGIDRKYFGVYDLNYATKMANLAAVYQETGDLDTARALFESALKIRETKLGTEHPDYVFNQYNLAVLYQRMQHYSLALPLFKKISAFYIRQIREIFPAMSEQEKSAFYSKIQGVINAYQDFVVEHAAMDKTLLSELLDFRLQTKALLLNSSTVIRNRILNSGETELMGKFTNWLQTKEQLAYLFSLSAEERVGRKNDVEALQQKANTLEKELSARSELFASTKSAMHWREVQAALKPGEAIIEIIRLGLNLKNDSVIYAALIVKPGFQNPSMIVMPQGRSMEKREFSYYRNTILYRIPNERSYHTYWEPLEAHLSDVTTIYFSPDGIYNKINVQTLYDPARKQYLIDRVSVKLVSNPKELLAKSNQASSIPHAVLIGFPDYLQNATENRAALPPVNGTSAAFELIRGSIDALPGTREEVLKIEKLLRSNRWNVNLYLSEKATEEMVKAQRSPALLHIATHGFFIQEAAENNGSGNDLGIANTERNPLLRSGLMLAGAEKNLVNQRMGKTRKNNTDDGILTAYEAMNMNLQGTDLVVLSACETGAGEVRNGEGVYGLQRSFLVAGANCVMMSLWKVSDEATQELMVLFYRHWLTLGDKRKAFHEMQLELRKNYPDPFYWGAFVIIGK
jgi:CHAT domain-containing protein/Tfp pilus assembly protein PilF